MLFLLKKKLNSASARNFNFIFYSRSDSYVVPTIKFTDEQNQRYSDPKLRAITALEIVQVKKSNIQKNLTKIAPKIAKYHKTQKSFKLMIWTNPNSEL